MGKTHVLTVLLFLWKTGESLDGLGCHGDAELHLVLGVVLGHKDDFLIFVCCHVVASGSAPSTP